MKIVDVLLACVPRIAFDVVMIMFVVKLYYALFE